MFPAFDFTMAPGVARMNENASAPIRFKFARPRLPALGAVIVYRPPRFYK